MGELPGVALVVRAGTVVHSVGSADERCPVASVAKQFVAAAILLLAERGTVSLDDPVDPWDFTIRQLLTHTSGLGHWAAVGSVEGFVELDAAGRFAAIRDAEPVGRPGERWSYSGLGYVLLASIVERATGIPYGLFAGAELFGPAGMSATVSGGTGLRSLPGTGDVVSTAADLVHYQAALPRLLRPESHRALGTAQADLGAEAYALPGVSAHAYGFGNFVGTIAGHPAVFHPGDNPGHQSLNAVLPDAGTVVVLLLHDETVRLSDVLSSVPVG